MCMVPKVADGLTFFMGAVVRRRSPGKLEGQKCYEENDQISTHRTKVYQWPADRKPALISWYRGKFGGFWTVFC